MTADLVNESSILATTNPLYLIGGLLFVGLAAWYSAYRYRNTNDFKKSVKLYSVFAVIAGAGLYIGFDIDLLLCAGVMIVGFIIVALVSNYYFYN